MMDSINGMSLVQFVMCSIPIIFSFFLETARFLMTVLLEQNTSNKKKRDHYHPTILMVSKLTKTIEIDPADNSKRLFLLSLHNTDQVSIILQQMLWYPRSADSI